MNKKKLADILAKRTGLDKGEIRKVLDELKDTSVYVRSSKRSGKDR